MRKKRTQHHERATSRAEHIFAGLVGISFAVLFIFFFSSFDLVDEAQGDWVPAQATIIQSEVVKNPQHELEYTYQLKYQFDFAEEQFSGNQLGVIPNTVYEASDWARQLQVGDLVTAYVNPEAPSEAVLLRDTNWLNRFGQVAFILIPLGLAIASFYSLVLAWKPQNKQASHLLAIKKRLRSEKGAIIFFLILGTMGLALFMILTVSPVAQWIESLTWDKTSCYVERARVISEPDSDGGEKYAPDVRYVYHVDRQTFRNDRFSLYPDFQASYQLAAQSLAPFKSGHKTFCYVNPENPADSILVHTMGKGPIVGSIFGGILMLAGFGSAFSLHKQKAEATTLVPTKSRENRAAPVELSLLKPKSYALGLVVLMGFAFIWNSAVAAVIGSEGSFVGAELIFLLVGLVIGAVALFGLLNEFRPKVYFAIHQPHFQHQVMSVEWFCKRGLWAMKRLQIELICREEADYMRGTDKMTEKFTLHSQSLLVTKCQDEMRKGSFDVTIPSDLMPSFSAPHNRIVWLFAVKGPTCFLKKHADEYVFQVLPQPIVPKVRGQL